MDPQLANLLAAIVATLDRVTAHPALAADAGLAQQVDKIRVHAAYLLPFVTDGTLPTPGEPGVRVQTRLPGDVPVRPVPGTMDAKATARYRGRT